MKAFKFTSLCTALILSVGLLAGCGSSENNGSGGSTSEAQSVGTNV